MSDGVVLDAREAFASEGRAGDLLWSADPPAPPIPLRRSEAATPPAASGPPPDPAPVPGSTAAAGKERVSGPRRLGEPVPTRVRADGRGQPLSVDGQRVDAVRESWLVEDRWWTDRPLRRRYWEVVTVDGRDLVVFRELVSGGWYRQRG